MCCLNHSSSITSERIIRITLFITLISFLLVSCVPAATTVPTEVASIPTIILTPPPSVSAITPASLPSPTATETPSFLISYTVYSDGGADLSTCLKGLAQPQFILYEDGELIVFKNGYKRTVLSQNEIDDLLNKISKTGLLEHSEKDYSEGRYELVVDGKRYHGAFGGHSDPLWKALNIIFSFQPKNLNQYVPESLLLEIYKIDHLESINSFLPQPTSAVQNWTSSYLFKYGEGWKIIRGKDVPIVMEQFDNFPDFLLFQEGDQYYVASICANFLSQ